MTPRDESGAGTDGSHVHLREVEKRVRAGELEPALEMLESLATSQKAGLPVEATLELLRSRLLGCYRKSVGDFATVPVLKSGGTSIQKLNLPPDAGFMLSLIDGSTSVADLITLSGMDTFDALRTLLRLDEAGIVGVPE